MRLLIIEDDERAAAYLARGLSESGHVVDVAGDGALGLAMAREGIYDVLIVDRLLPAMDGLELVRTLRRDDPRIGVLMLSAMAGTADRVAGMHAGCDDYLVKPYAFVEVLARIESLARRGDRSREGHVLQVGDLQLDVLARQLRRGDRLIALQPREYLLLEYLMRHADQVVTRTMLLEAVWDYDFDPQGSVVDMHVYRLRRKIEQDASPLLHTLPGVGYVLSTTPPVT
ncbi:winged helix family two component transcriptional regulator [Luteibacter rhizovicinus]|uniref:Winged helix family two component transcriptional regulator n=1 Tax=Luteibacter rhizovicinus TaxID=242606 RepID=A0A4R3YM32_9GAMM|nr:response regulator transcription factor [Luteibacter rhizovicinus]TCV93366.1 winged helix family two component transcriptional regulator [Luteibacter rhizovicinus]